MAADGIRSFPVENADEKSLKRALHLNCVVWSYLDKETYCRTLHCTAGTCAADCKALCTVTPCEAVHPALTPV